MYPGAAGRPYPIELDIGPLTIEVPAVPAVVWLDAVLTVGNHTERLPSVLAPLAFDPVLEALLELEIDRQEVVDASWALISEATG